MTKRFNTLEFIILFLLMQPYKLTLLTRCDESTKNAPLRPLAEHTHAILTFSKRVDSDVKKIASSLTPTIYL